VPERALAAELLAAAPPAALELAAPEAVPLLGVPAPVPPLPPPSSVLEPLDVLATLPLLERPLCPDAVEPSEEHAAAWSTTHPNPMLHSDLIASS
jgi:hypothetical protein